MKLSLNWIKDYVAIPEDMDLNRLCFDLTMSTVEVEGTEQLADRFDKMVVGLINEILPIEGADMLRLCKVDIGDGEIKDIVCGGSNIAEGMSVVIACPGAMVRWHGEGDLVPIKNTKLRGVASFGMICASVEVGLSDLFPQKDDHEIMDITGFGAAPGTPIANALELNDIIVEIDNKSMTNRPDLWGHYGIAREIAALYDLPLKRFGLFKAETSGLEIEIQDAERCPRYIGVKLEGLFVKQAPYKMRSRIWRVGMRPINALVDCSNYVMLATGQPTHVFDSDIIKGHIVVRRANENEKLELLNGKNLTLQSDDLVIADAQGPVALAGVMGGVKDSVLPTTNKVILEIANFESTGIRRTALRYDNRTEASSRYEKAIDPERCAIALDLFINELKALYPDMKLTGFCDCYPKKLVKKEITVEVDWLMKRLGKRISNEEIAKKLGLLGFETEFEGESMRITVPTWRSTGDVSMKADIMEEVARMYGYENFEPTPITTSFKSIINQLDIDLVRKLKEYLALRCGMQEIFTYPWMSDDCVAAVLGSAEGVLALATPPTPTEKYLRSSLLPNLCKAVAKNERYFSDFSIFEEAQVFFDRDYASDYDENERLPLQRRHIAGAFASDANDLTALFRRAKGVVENMPRYTHMEGFTFAQNEKPYWADNIVWLNIMSGDKKVGDMGLLNKKAALGCGVKRLSAILFEIDTDSLKPFTSRTNKFTHIPEFPTNDYDFSMLFDADMKWEKIYQTAMQKKKPGGLIKSISFIDEYKGAKIPNGKKSVTIRLVIGSDEKTLTFDEVAKCAETVIKHLSRTLGSQMRVE